jgi:membrane protein YqaA with SNARE-associated domain
MNLRICFHNKVKNLVAKLQSFVDQKWYSPLIALLVSLDNIILIIPTDGLLISSALLKPKKWIGFALTVSFGSTLGALLLALIVKQYGIPFINEFYPQVMASKSWILTKNFFDLYGLWVVLIVSAGPVMQQPAIVIAALANTEIKVLLIPLLAGRLFKFLLLAYISSHAPRFLSRLWGIQTELEEVGFKQKIDKLDK